MWKIDKKYKGILGATDKSLGKQIDVYVQTIGNVHEEYLVNFKYFEKMMNEYGFEKILIKPFEDFYNELINGENKMNLDEQELQKMKGFAESMSDEEKRFSFLSSAFIFKKVENSSDKLYKKLVELMEKKSKTDKETVKSVTKNVSDLLVQNDKLNTNDKK